MSKLAWRGGWDELTNVAIWVTVFGEVSLSLLKDCSQSSRVVNVSVRAVRMLKPVSSTVQCEPVALKLSPDVHCPGPPFLSVNGPVEFVCEETSVERLDVESMRGRE
jgi:hypothetical protein